MAPRLGWLRLSIRKMGIGTGLFIQIDKFNTSTFLQVHVLLSNDYNKCSIFGIALVYQFALPIGTLVPY